MARLLEREARQERDGAEDEVRGAAEIFRAGTAAEGGRPTPKSENPIEVTTTAATMGVMMRRHQRANRPSTPSMRPPTMTAPRAPQQPWVAAMRAGHGDEGEADAHDNGKPAAHAPDGEQLHEGADAGDEHGV